ncbi:T9SS type A sorting domain-containing protein [candidate division GN15 bacterium]|nr:T9SS type A sorting domain-containing protein [candidate division GN15 bacterium]
MKTRTCALRALAAAFLVIAVLSPVASAEVYLNMQWDDQSGGFRLKPLVLDGGAYYDRDYQNAYGEYLELDPGPPYIIQSSISATGTVTFASGGFDPMNPFDITVQSSAAHPGRLLAAQGFNFVGTPLDPIRLQGTWKMEVGLDYQDGGSEMVWSYTTFDNTYSADLGNSVPIEISGLGLQANNCLIRNLSTDFFYLMSINDFDAGNQEYAVSFEDCTFEHLDFFDGMWYAIRLSNLRAVSFVGCRFDNVDVSEYAGGGLVLMETCGIGAIANNTSVHNNYSKIHMIDAWATDSAYIKTSDALPIVANDIVIPTDSALVVAPGSVLKFLWSGGFETHGRLYVDSAILTSHQDDRYGGDTDLEPQPFPILDRWQCTGSAGIVVDNGGSASVTNTRILHAEGGIRAADDLTVSDSYFADCEYFGLYLDSPGADTFRVSNTTITRTLDGSYGFMGGIVYRNAASAPQALLLDSVAIIGSELDGLYVAFAPTQPGHISIANSTFIDNEGYGIYVPSDPLLTSFSLTNSIVAGNYNSGLYIADQFYQGGDVLVEGCAVIGNGYGRYAADQFGLDLPNSPPTVVGNTIAYNAGIGLAYWDVDSIQQTVVANNIMYRNGDYGLFAGNSGDYLLAANAIWENGDQEVRVESPAGRLYTVEGIQALGGEYATNLHVDPGFTPERIGQIDYLQYDSSSWVTRVVDSDLSGHNMTGLCICPDTASPEWHYILYQIVDTLYVTGDIRDSAHVGSTYRIFDHHLSPTSPLIDTGRTASTSQFTDLDGQVRILDGDENGSMIVDIGADEFDPQAGQPFVRITSPENGEILLSNHTFEIEWESEGVDEVDIRFIWDTEFGAWDTVVENTSASAGSYSWTTPLTASIKCRLHIYSSSDDAIGDYTEHFGIKGYQLSRVGLDSLLEPFLPQFNGWSLANDSATCWPDTWFSRFDYQNGIDTITGLVYPPYFANDFWYGAEPSDFPDWPLFVDVFGVDQCYYPGIGGYIYRPSAVAFWGDNKDAWGGSCSGFAFSSSLGFFDSTAFLARYPGVGSFLFLHDLAVTDERRRTINELWFHQMGEPHHSAYLNNRATPQQTLELLKEHLHKSLTDGAVLAIGNNRLGAAHDVLPYAMSPDNSGPGLYRVYVYDSNHPSDVARFVLIDSANNSWSYADFPAWSGADGFCVLTDSLSNYLQTPQIPGSNSPKGVLSAARADGRLRVYPAPSTNLMLIDTLGRRAGYDDSIVLDIPDALPLITRSGPPGPPRGYELPLAPYAVALENTDTGRCSFAVYGDSVVYRYSRAAAQSGAIDTLTIDSGLAATNHDADPKTVQLYGIAVGDSEEKEFIVSDWQQEQNQRAAWRLVGDGELHLWNSAGSETVSIRMRVSSADGCVAADAHSVIIPGGGARSAIVPDWSDPSLENTWLFHDSDDNGVYDDSSLLAVVTEVGDLPEDEALPYRFALSQNYPNPFNPVTTIEYSLPEQQHVTIDIFNVLGQRVCTIVDRRQPAGTYGIDWDATDQSGSPVATGVYLYRFRAGDYVETKKMLLVR